MNKFQSMGLWSLDYTPQTIDDVTGNSEIKYIFSRFLSEGYIPNILLTGSHGTCKRTLATILAKSYLGKHYDRACLQIDGAVCRSKDVITPNYQKKATDKINSYSGPSVLEFAKHKLFIDGKAKLIVIYNFDDMLSEAQNALLRIIEQYSQTTRFILLSNTLDTIIEAVQSRCLLLRTALLTDTESRELISNLSIHRGIKPLPDDIIQIICMLSAGDIKKIVNYVQTISVIPDVTIERFHEVFNVPPVSLLSEMLKDILSESTQEKALERVTLLLNQGYNYTDILDMLSKILSYTECIPIGYRMMFLEDLSKAYCEMTLYTANVHLYGLFSRFASRTR